MKIEYVTPHFWPVTGGVETHVYRLASGLKMRGHEIVVHTAARTASGAALPPRDILDGIAIRRYRYVYHFGYYVSLFRPEISANCDVVHLHAYAHFTNDYLIKKLHGKKPLVLTTHHGVGMPHTGVRKVLRKPYDRVRGLPGLRKLDRIVVVSDADRAWLRAHAPDIPQEHIVTIPNGLDDEAFMRPLPSELPEALSTSDYVLYLGRLHREKCIDHLIKAFSMLSNRKILLVLAGPDDGDAMRLHALAGTHGVADRTLFLGRVSEPQKRALLHAAHFLVLPSRYEAFGIVLLEAWAQGSTFVASRVGGIPYMVEDGETGLLYEFGDVNALKENMERLLADRELAMRIGRRGLELARSKYAWSAVIDATERLYEAVLRR